MFIILSVISTFLVHIASSREVKIVGFLALIVVLAQIFTAFAEYGFLGGLGALSLATLVEGIVISALAKGRSSKQAE